MTRDTAFTGCTSLKSTSGRTAPLRTLAQQGALQQLELALDNMQSADPPVPFAGRWPLLQSRAYGGQALVQVRRAPFGWRQDGAA